MLRKEDVKVEGWYPGHNDTRGGQHVGVKSGVRLTHMPTGIQVIEERERSQLRNRERALRELTARVEEVAHVA